nr:MAG TPA: hypothetical protein [Caudoviricetes sp.]
MNCRRRSMIYKATWELSEADSKSSKEWWCERLAFE